MKKYFAVVQRRGQIRPVNVLVQDESIYKAQQQIEAIFPGSFLINGLVEITVDLTLDALG